MLNIKQLCAGARKSLIYNKLRGWKLHEFFTHEGNVSGHEAP